VQPDRLARVPRRIAVEGKRLDAQLAGLVQLQKLGHLILRQRLGRKQIQCLGVLGHGRGDDGQGVAQGFARCGRRHHRHVIARLRCRPRLCLMAV